MQPTRAVVVGLADGDCAFAPSATNTAPTARKNAIAAALANSIFAVFTVSMLQARPPKGDELFSLTEPTKRCYWYETIYEQHSSNKPLKPAALRRRSKSIEREKFFDETNLPVVLTQ